jgi:hypothetical protein
LAKNGVGHIAAHATTGGVISVLRGGKFGHGFFSAGITKGLTPHFEGIGGSDFEVNGYNIAEATITGVLGGTISQATGGKFANGAVTAAMGNLFNNQGGGRKGTRSNPHGERLPGHTRHEVSKGVFAWIPQSMVADSYLANETGTTIGDYTTTTKEDVINVATGVATVTGFGGLAFGSARLGYAAIGSGFFAWSLNPSAEGAGWLAVDVATMRLGPLVDATVFEGVDHAIASYSLLYQTANAVQSCQVPLRCE